MRHTKIKVDWHSIGRNIRHHRDPGSHNSAASAVPGMALTIIHDSFINVTTGKVGISLWMVPEFPDATTAVYLFIWQRFEPSSSFVRYWVISHHIWVDYVASAVDDFSTFVFYIMLNVIAVYSCVLFLILAQITCVSVILSIQISNKLFFLFFSSIHTPARSKRSN